MSYLKYSLEEINSAIQRSAIGVTSLTILSVDSTLATAQFEVTPTLHQPAGILNGGFSFLIAETVISAAANAMLPSGVSCVGVDMSGSHLEPVIKGIVRVEARPLRIGSRMQVWESCHFREDGKKSFVARFSLLVKGTL